MNEISITELSRWLAEVIDGDSEPTAIEQFSGGQSNPTYRVDVGNRCYVLRRKPFGSLLPSAHAIDREFRLLSALSPMDFPVPRPIALCEDDSVIGSMFYLMEMVEGSSYWNGLLPEVWASDRRAYYEALVDTVARLHSIDPVEVGLGDFGPGGSYLARQVQRWTRQYRATQTDDIAEVEKLIDWLPRSLPQQKRLSIIHGDYRIDNVVFASNGPQVQAVLDWELATLGDPLADFAYFAMSWVIPRDGRSGLGGIDLKQEGIPSLEEIVGRYCTLSGLSGLPDLHWYFAFNLFRLVGILQGIKRRIDDGNASNPDSAQAVERLESFARLAWSEARLAGAKD